MSTLVDYKGLQVVSPSPSGAGGLAIQNDLKQLVDWQPKSVWAQTADPGVSDDSSQDYYPGSQWMRTDITPAKLFVCRNATVGAAVWEEIDNSPNILRSPDNADRNTIVAPTASVCPLTISGATAHTANLQEWRTDSGQVAYIAPDGALFAAAIYGRDSGYLLISSTEADTTDIGFWVKGSPGDNGPRLEQADSGVGLQFTREEAVVRVISSTGYAPLECGARVSSDPCFTVFAISGQTAPLTEWKNSVGTTVLSVDAAGALVGPTTVSIKVSGTATIQADADSGSGNTRFLLYDNDTGQLQRVKVGPSGSGPSGSGRALYLS